MNAKTKILLAGSLLTCTQAVADGMPDVCKTAINYAAQTLNLGLSDGSFAGSNDPQSVTLNKDFTKYPLTNVKLLGSCEVDGANLKQSWCQVDGGSPSVYQADVALATGEAGGSYPLATIVVTYNRGGCSIDAIDKK